MSLEHNSYQPDESINVDSIFIKHYVLPVDIPINSPQYQNYLELNRIKEEDLDNYGQILPETQAAYLEALRAVDQLAMEIYMQSFTNKIRNS